MFRRCEQCGMCSSACPLTGKNGFNVRQIIRFLDLDLQDEVADSPLPWECTTCGRCEDACPNGIKILDIIRYLRRIGPDKWAPPAAACMLACPAHINVPEYVRLIAEGKAGEAYEVIRETVPFAGVLGRVCTRSCETKCRRGEVNGPVPICALKRYVADESSASYNGRHFEGRATTGRKVAVIGAGPAGLTAAFYLCRKGHSVTVFEKQPKAGGMLVHAIPAYRLPEKVVEKEIMDVLSVGIELKCGQALGKDFGIGDLKDQGYDAIFIATGSQMSRHLELEGIENEGVLRGLEFLYEMKEGKAAAMKDRVVVIGGGNVAVDVARTALRLGAKEVRLVCLETPEEMPASKWEIDQAAEEGVQIMTSWGPAKVLGQEGKVKGVEVRRCTGVFDTEGRFNPAYDDLTRMTVDSDLVILAIGQAADLSIVVDSHEIRTERDLVVVDAATKLTTMDGVFAGGDVTGRPGTIIDAIAAGREAASAIDKSLGGDGKIGDLLPEAPPDRTIAERREKGFADQKRFQPGKLASDKRRNSFKEVETGFSRARAVVEAKRCFGCDLEIAYCKRPTACIPLSSEASRT
jgi:NADPH-dependent glutamate synthase beta subunit-like oxidoreductase